MPNIIMADNLSPGSNLSTDVKDALLACFSHVAWTNEHGQDYYDALESALYPPADLVSISAVYTQSGTVYDTDSLDSLKSDLVVTATYEDNTERTVTDYTLSGTLTVGTSAITVSYGGKTATFNVSVTKHGLPITFLGGYSISKESIGQEYPGCKLIATAARMAMTEPIANNGYVFDVTDATKYQVAAYDITILDRTAGGFFPAGNKTVSWTTSDSVTTAYVWVAFKKLDGTDFTQEEIDNAEGTVFTCTEGV